MNSQAANLGILFLRLFSGGMMLLHGIPKVGMLIAGNGSAFLNPIGIGSTTSLALAIFAEVVCAAGIIAGGLTRLCAMILCFNMIVATMYQYQSGAPFLSGMELPLLYFGMYFTLMLTGAGNYSVDGYIANYER